jgi:2-deoxy-D-gluconate 3-dehydrogenase
MALERFSLAGRTALVTGASRGIGAAIARALAEAGADVALAARSSTALAAVAAEIEAVGRRAFPVVCDVTSRDQVEACAREAEERLGRIDVLVNNAGGPLFNALALEIRDEGWERLIALNLTSVFRFCQAVGRGMVARGRGSVINVSSVAGSRPWPALAAYSAAKAGVLSLTQVLALEWGEAGVRVNAICPGWVMTDINERFLADAAARSLALDAVPLRRLGQVEDVVGAALWLASDASSYVTGATIAIDGGVAPGVPEDWRALRLNRPGKHGSGDR